MKFSPNCRTKKSRMIYTILESFCSILNWEWASIWPQIRPRKIPVSFLENKALMAIAICQQEVKERCVI